MRHVGANDRDVARLRHPLAREVQRLVEAVAPAAVQRFESYEILRGGAGCVHRREARRVRRDDEVLAEAALQAESRHAERRVLERQVQVAFVERRFGDPPRHAATLRVIDLPLDDHPARVVDEAAVRRVHQQRRHQVLEHRARPRHEHRLAAHGDQRASEPEPVLGQHVVLGDRDEARQACLRRQQVVERRIEPPAVELVADREQLARRVVQEAEIHFGEERVRLARDTLQPLDQPRGVPLDTAQHFAAHGAHGERNRLRCLELVPQRRAVRRQLGERHARGNCVRDELGRRVVQRRMLVRPRIRVRRDAPRRQLAEIGVLPGDAGVEDAGADLDVGQRCMRAFLGNDARHVEDVAGKPLELRPVGRRPTSAPPGAIRRRPRGPPATGRR